MPFDERYRCEAQSSRQGRRCRNRKIRGSTVCRFHGAGAPHVREKAAWRVEEERLRSDAGRMLHELELEDRSVEEVLPDLVRRADAMMRLLAVRAADEGMDPDSRWFLAYRQAMKDTGAIGALVGGLRLEERRVIVDEERAELMASFVRAVLNELGHSLEDPRVIDVMRRHYDSIVVGETARVPASALRELEA